jgi:hypothetical protein
VASPAGHSYGRVWPPTRPIDPDRWRESAEYAEGIALFNAGYYWEAHEVWERLWNAEGRRGAVAELLKALIKLAAAGVKAREGRVGGVVTHLTRAASGLRAVEVEAGPRLLGLELGRLRRWVEELASHPPLCEAPREAAVVRVFAEPLRPE